MLDIIAAVILRLNSSKMDNRESCHDNILYISKHVQPIYDINF